MYIYLISILLVTIISLCFFKKNFWQNRYLILAIIGGVSLVGTLTSGYIVRDRSKTKVEFSNNSNLIKFNLSKKLFKDSSAFICNNKFDINDYKFDSLKKFDSSRKRTMSIAFECNNKKEKFVIIIKSNELRYTFGFNNIYILSSNSDSVAYFCKKPRNCI